MERKPGDRETGVALVSGATGFLGARLAEVLRAAGRPVVAVVRGTSDTTALEALGARIVRDAGSTEALAVALRPFAPTTLFHLAAKFVAVHRTGDVDDLIEANLGFATRLAEAALAAGCGRIVVAGTSWQVDAEGVERPNSLYAATKSAFETLLAAQVAAAGGRAVALRLYETYGPGDPRRKLLALLLAARASGERLGLSPGEQRLDFVHVDDVAAAFLAAEARLAERPAGTFERFAVRSGRAVTVRELVGLIETVGGTPLPVVFGERPYRDGEVMVPAPGAVLPGWRPATSLEDGLAAMLGRVPCSR